MIAAVQTDNDSSCEQDSNGYTLDCKRIPNEELVAELGVKTNRAFLAVYVKIRYMKKLKSFDFEGLNKEIWRRWKSEGMTVIEYKERVLLTDGILQCIRKGYPRAMLLPMGSTVSLCGSKDSDLDLCLALEDRNRGYETSRRSDLESLGNVAALMNAENDKIFLTGAAELIEAKIPIVVATVLHGDVRVKVDINCNNVPGVYNSHLLRCYARFDDRFPSLCMAVKKWARFAGINNAMNGGLNSYSLALMVLHFLQCAVFPPVLPNLQALFPLTFRNMERQLLEDLKYSVTPPKIPGMARNDMSVAELLVGFFQYYTNFNYDRDGISIEKGLVFDRTRMGLFRDAKFVIEGPYDFVNTARTVRRSSDLNAIKEAFSTAAFKCMGPLSSYTRPKDIGLA